MLQAEHTAVSTEVYDYGTSLDDLSIIENFNSVLLVYPDKGIKVEEVLANLTSTFPNLPVIIVSESGDLNALNNLVKVGAADYVQRNALHRLPVSLYNAIEKYYLRADQEKYFNELIARKTLMKDAERLAHFGSWREDLATGKLYWSDEKFRILGYNPGEVKPSWEHFYNQIHHEDVQFVKNTIEEAIDKRNRQKFTFRIVSAKGLTKYIHSEIFVTRNADLSIAQLNGFIRDISEHTRAEIRFVESEEKYRNLFENNPSALFVADAHSNRFIDVNRAAINQYGYSREELLNLSVFDILPEEHHNGGLPDIGSQPYVNNNDVVKNRRKDGKYIKVEVTVSEIVYEGRSAWLILANDVTDKLLTIARLKESEARLITSQRIAHVGSWEILYKNNIPDFSTTKWTDETYRIFGYKPMERELTVDFLKDVVHPDDHAALVKARENTTPEKSEYSIEYRILTRKGEERIVSELGEVSFNPFNGERVKLSGTIQDITERNKAAEALSTSEANLRSIFENTDTIYSLLDTQLCVVSFNRQASNFAEKHFQRKIRTGTIAWEYFPADMQQLLRKALEKALEGNNLNFESCFDEGGVHKWYNAHFHPVWSNEKTVIGVIMSFRDITERKTAEFQEKKISEDLIKRNKDLEQFAYIISHNLRAPVANIMGISEILNDEEMPDTERKTFMEGLQDSIKKLDTVIIDLNRILQMKNEVNEVKEHVKFSQLVNDIKTSISGMDDTGMYQISTDFSAVDDMVTLRSYMYSIFYNLISNSLKYKQPSIIPVIHIASIKAPNTLILKFQDNGLGIDLEKNGSKLFGLYKRFHTNAAEGKGMGLFMVKTQVETLGGKITVNSKVNVGTEFTLEFEVPDE